MNAVALSCQALVKRYEDVVAVDGLSLEVRRGECFGLLGPNGAGKTTTVEMLEGLTPSDDGAVEVLGMSWARDASAIRERLGVQLQEARHAEKLTVLETIRLFRSFYREGRPAEEALAMVGLEEKAGAWVRKLSGGQRQRLSLACALVARPEILFLDEPTTGLDPQSRRQAWEIVGAFRDAGGTVVLTTHYMEEAQRLCDRVAIMDHGKIIAQGTPRELIASLGAEHVVELEADGAEPAALEALAGINGAAFDGATVRLTVTQLHHAVPALLAELDRQRVPLTGLATHHATLEDVFVSLTGRHLRDE